MPVCLLPPPVQPRPMPSTAVLPALRHGYPEYPCSDTRMTEPPRGNPEFARRLRAARLAAGMTQKQLGEAVGVSSAMVTHWERGFRGIWLENLLAVADALGVHPVSLLPGVPPPAPVVFLGPYVCAWCRIEGVQG